MKNKWVKIRSFEKFYLAEIIKGYLIENNIPAIVLNKKDTILLHHSGQVELYVEKNFRSKALEILKDR